MCQNEKAEMNDDEIKTHLATMLEQANIRELSDGSIEKDFVKGSLDIAFDKLDMDSLARLQLCIAIEIELGVSIVPEQLCSMRSLNSLLQEIKTGLE